MDVVKKDTRLDHLQKKKDELCILLKEGKGEAIKEFKASNKFIDLLDRNHSVGFKGFCMNAMECFPEVDFSPIELNIGVASSLF